MTLFLKSELSVAMGKEPFVSKAYVTLLLKDKPAVVMGERPFVSKASVTTRGKGSLTRFLRGGFLVAMASVLSVSLRCGLLTLS